MGRPRKRRRSVIPRGAQSMIVIAGLPKATHQQSVDKLGDRFPEAIVVGAPSPLSDGALYSEQTIASIIRAAGEFAIRRRTNGPNQPSAPAKIALLYVPAPDDECLLRAFDFSILPAPLATLAIRNEQGRQRRHILDDVHHAHVEAWSPAGPVREALNNVVRRLAYQSDNEALLLPPRNFLVNGRDLVPIFQAYRRGERLWTDRLIDYGPVKLNHENIGRIEAGKTRHAFVDHRGMSFLIAHPTAYHAPQRQLDDAGLSEIKSALRSLYRFGGALPSGIHHDAQRDDGSPLCGAEFYCDQEGHVRAEGTHANIYPDDFVRAETKNRQD